MKTIDLSRTVPTLSDILVLAGEDTIILKTTEGREFVLAEVDDFAREVELVAQNEELMQFLEQRSKEAKRYTLSQVREQLNNKP
ncbi:MAG: hypothetical protein GDA56_28945 [Hormoscilla sp. GM7CHS1pb]|nr:hypothetical protein [Hormoscilla sp. GM7CHS1pb]